MPSQMSLAAVANRLPDAQSSDDKLDQVAGVVARVAARPGAETPDAKEQFVGIQAGTDLTRRSGSLKELPANARNCGPSAVNQPNAVATPGREHQQQLARRPRWRRAVAVSVQCRADRVAGRLADSRYHAILGHTKCLRRTSPPTESRTADSG